MHVLIIADVNTEGGATKSMIGLVLWLKKHEIDVTVLTSKKTWVNALMNQNGIRNYCVHHGAFLQASTPYIVKNAVKYIIRKLEYCIGLKRSFRLASKYVNFHDIDLVYTNVNRNDLGALLATKYNKPHIWHIREFSFEDFDCWSYRKNITKFMNDNTDRFICVSDAVRKCWINRGLDNTKCITIYNGIDYRKIKKRSDYRSGRYKMVMVGGISKNKGQYLVIELLNSLPPSIRKCVSLDIIGDGDRNYIRQLKKQINDYGMSNVNLIGPRNNIGTLLCDYDIGVTCSKSEAFGRVTVEYMMAGLPVLVSNTGANPELVRDGVDGRIFKYGDIQDMRNKFIYIIDNYNALGGENTYIYALNNFSAEINAENIYGVYKSVLEK